MKDAKGHGSDAHNAGIVDAGRAAAFAAEVRNFNGAFVKTFAKELKAERLAKYAARARGPS